MTEYKIVGTPIATASIINLEPGESEKQDAIYTVSDDRLSVIDSIGINAYLPTAKTLLTSVMPVLDSGLTVKVISK